MARAQVQFLVVAMPDLLTTIREALVAEGASPATAELLASDFVHKARRKVERDRRDNEAQRLLHLGWPVVAERFSVCKSAVYKMAKRARARSTVSRSSVDRSGVGLTKPE